MTVTSNIVLGVAAWQSSHAYSLGDLVTTSFPRAYQCAKAGTSASSGGPSGTGSSIADGTATWNYVCDVSYNALQSWANAIPATLTQPYIGRVLSAGLINMDATLSTLTPYLSLSGHTTSPTNTITLTAFPGFGFRDKLAVPGTALALNTNAVGFIVTLRGQEYDLNAFDISDANVIFDGLQFYKIGPTDPTISAGSGSIVLNGHTYTISTDGNTNILKDGVAVPNSGGTATAAGGFGYVWGEDGGSGDWFRLINDGTGTFDGPAYSLSLLNTNSGSAPNFVLRNCIVSGITDNFGVATIVIASQAALYNNLILDSQGPHGQTAPIRSWGGSESSGSIYVNNTFIRRYSNASNIFVFISAPSNTGGYIFKNNISIGSGTAFNCEVTANADHTATDFSSAYGGSVVNGGGNLTSITPSAVFVNTTTDFRLKQGASVINAGVSDTTHVPSATDIIGNPRVGTTWDIGAVEFTSSASAATKTLQFGCVSSATLTAPAVNASASAAVVFTATVALGLRTLVSAATPVLFTANVQLGSRTLVTATPAFNIGVLFSNARLETFVTATNRITLANTITAQLWDVCSLIQPVVSLTSSVAAVLDPWSAHGGGAIVTAGGALLTHPTLANATASVVFNATATTTLFAPFDCSALIDFPTITAQVAVKSAAAVGFASLPTFTASAQATFGRTVLFLVGAAPLQFTSTVSLSSFTNVAASTGLVVSANALSVGSDPVTTATKYLTFSAAGVGGQQLLIPATVITLPPLTLAGSVGSSCFGISKFSLAATIRAGGEIRAAGTFEQLMLSTPQPVSLLLQTDAITPLQLQADRTNVWITELIQLPFAPVPLRADISGKPTVLLNTSSSVTTTWPTITSATTAINSLGARATDTVLTFTAVAAGQQFDLVTATVALSVVSTITAGQSNLAAGSAVLPTLTMGATSAAELHDTASITATLSFVAIGQFGQSNPVSGTETLPLAVAAQAVTSELASAAILWPILGIGDGGGEAFLGNGANLAAPLLQWAAAGSAEQDNPVSATSLLGLTPSISVTQEALASAAVTCLSFTTSARMLQFWEAEAQVTWPTLTAYSVPSLFAAGTIQLDIAAVADCLNTTDYTTGFAAVSFTAVGDAFNPPTVFTSAASPLSRFAFAFANASINAGQFSATLSLPQFGALAQCAQFVPAAAELSWTINMATGSAQARLWATPPGFTEGSDTVWWSA